MAHKLRLYRRVHLRARQAEIQATQDERRPRPKRRKPERDTADA